MRLPMEKLREIGIIDNIRNNLQNYSTSHIDRNENPRGAYPDERIRYQE